MLWVKYTNRSGAIKALTVDFLIIYTPATNQLAASYFKVSSYLLMLN